MPSRCLAILLTSTALVLPLAPAYALEPEAAAQALGDALVKGTGGKASFDAASMDGDKVVIEGLKITSHDASDTVSFATTTIEAPEEGDRGVFSSPLVEMSEGTVSGESAGTIGSATLTNIVVLDPAKAGKEALDPGLLFEEAEAFNIDVGAADQNYKVKVARVAMTMTDVVGNAPQASSGSVEKIEIPPEAFAKTDFNPGMLGYDNVVLNVTWDGSRDIAAKTMTLRDLTLSMEGGGSVSLSGVLGNLPEPSVIQREKRAEAASKVVIHSAELRYEDESLAGKVLEMQAKKQGVSREEYAQQIAGALPFLLAALNNAQFQNEVAAALGTFLQDPQSLTVKVEPETPITGAEILGIVGTAPQTLPDRLKASISANTAE
jgi:hypothetical protein